MLAHFGWFAFGAVLGWCACGALHSEREMQDFHDAMYKARHDFYAELERGADEVREHSTDPA